MTGQREVKIVEELQDLEKGNFENLFDFIYSSISFKLFFSS